MKNLFKIFIILIIVFLTPLSLANAEQPNLGIISNIQQEETPEDNENSGYYLIFIRLIFFFLIMMAIIFIVFLLTKIRKKRFAILKSNYIEVIDSIQLGINKGIYIIRVLNEVIVVSFDEKSIDYLFKLNEHDARELIESSEDESQNNTFKNHLNSLNKLLKKEDKSRESNLEDKINKISEIRKSVKNLGEGEIDK